MKKIQVISVLTLLLVSVLLSNRQGQGRHLILCVDGVSFSEFQKSRKEGRFAYLQAPARLISPFPSLTNPAMVTLLRPAGAPQAPGYEDNYYSWSENRMKGGIRERFGKTFIKGTFRELFAFHPSSFESSIEYVVPPFSCTRMARVDFRNGLEAFKKSKEATYTVYLGPTDCTVHTGGSDSLQSALKTIDGELEDLLKKHPQTRITLFSDHGNEIGEYRRLDVERILKNGGFELDNRLDHASSVVAPLYGLIGAVVVHTQPGRERAVAQLFSKSEGVHFARFKRGNTVYLISRGEEARIEQSDGKLRYSPGRADPLRLGQPPARTQLEWFESTKEHRYPDGVNRVWLGSGNTVKNEASVLVDLASGFYAGSKFLDVFVKLRATHGNLGREQSIGFAATSSRPLPSYLSARDAWHQFTGKALPFEKERGKI